MRVDQQPAVTLNEQDIHNLASQALDKIISSPNPTLLVWEAQGCRLRAVSAAAGYATSMIKKPACLGMYDFNARLQDIIEDFKFVCCQA